MFEPLVAVGIAVGFLSGLIAHELAHNVLATRLGDPTPRLMGRMTAKVTAHADVLGTYVFGGIFLIAGLFGQLGSVNPFGWTRKHALGARGFRGGRRDAVLVSLAGPAAAALLAVVFGRLTLAAEASQVALVFYAAAKVCSALAMIELLPIPGLDGARVLAAFLQPHAASRLEELAEYKVLYLLVLFLILPGIGVDVAGSMVSVACDALAGVLC